MPTLLSAPGGSLAWVGCIPAGPDFLPSVDHKDPWLESGGWKESQWGEGHGSPVPPTAQHPPSWHCRAPGFIQPSLSAGSSNFFLPWQAQGGSGTRLFLTPGPVVPLVAPPNHIATWYMVFYETFLEWP